MFIIVTKSVTECDEVTKMVILWKIVSNLTLILAEFMDKFMVKFMINSCKDEST